MTRKERRIAEIMDEMGVDRDVAEQLFRDELWAKYPELTEGNQDVAETLYESEHWRERG